MISSAVYVAERVEGFWAWYMTWGHPQGPALDLSDDPRLVGDATGQLMYIHHRFWQQRLPVWEEVWNREFDKAREAQRNKLIYLDSMGELNNDGVGAPTLLYNPADETSVWRYWVTDHPPGPRPDSPPTVQHTHTARRSQRGLRTRIASTRRHPGDRGLGVCPLGPAQETALGEWDLSWYWDIPHEHAAWYVNSPEWDMWGNAVWQGRSAGPEPPGPVRYDPAIHGALTSRITVADGGRLRYLPATVADGAGFADIVEALKPWRPEGFPDDPDAYGQMWRHDVGGGSWHKKMGQLVLLVPADELVAWLEANGYDPQRMFAQGWPNPDEEQLIRNTWPRTGTPATPKTGATSSRTRSAGWEQGSRDRRRREPGRRHRSSDPHISVAGLGAPRPPQHRLVPRKPGGVVGPVSVGAGSDCPLRAGRSGRLVRAPAGRLGYQRGDVGGFVPSGSGGRVPPGR